jgi:hypothetical protein
VGGYAFEHGLDGELPQEVFPALLSVLGEILPELLSNPGGEVLPLFSPRC